MKRDVVCQPIIQRCAPGDGHGRNISLGFDCRRDPTDCRCALGIAVPLRSDFPCAIPKRVSFISYALAFAVPLLAFAIMLI